MKVSEVARAAGVAPSAVRFYERSGVLPAAARADNGYRDYTGDDLCRLELVVRLRALGLDLTAAGRLADLCLTGHCDDMSRDLRPLVAAQREEVARRRAELDALDRDLARVEATLAGGNPLPDGCITEKGGETDDRLLRTGLPVPTDTRLPVLTPGC